MRFSTVTVLTTLSALASAVPVKKQNSIAGAVYFLTNEPDGNFIISSQIGQDGKLTLKQATKTGGNGGHGVTDPIGPDPMFSQGSIKVSGNNVFAVNPGSSTVSMFALDPNDPSKLTAVGNPVGSGGDFPVSLAISKKTGQVCVLNGGRQNGVNCFKQDKSLGLIQIDNTQRSLSLNQTTSPNGPAGTVSHVLFSEDDTKLIASVKGVPPQPGFLASWDIDSKTGELSPDFVKSTPGKGGLLPFGMTIIPGQNAVLATDAGIGFDIFDFKNVGGSGKNAQSASSKVFPVKGQGAICWTAFSKKTNDFFMTDIDTGLITEVNVDKNLNAKIIKQYSQGNNTSLTDLDIATVGNNDFMYTLASGIQSVLVHSLGAPGQAKQIQQLQFADAAKKAGLKTSSNNLQGMTVFVAGA